MVIEGHRRSSKVMEGHRRSWQKGGGVQSRAHTHLYGHGAHQPRTSWLREAHGVGVLCGVSHVREPTAQGEAVGR